MMYSSKKNELATLAVCMQVKSLNAEGGDKLLLWFCVVAQGKLGRHVYRRRRVIQVVKRVHTTLATRWHEE